MRQYSTVVQDVYIRLAQSEIDALNAAGSDFDLYFSFFILLQVIILISCLRCLFVLKRIQSLFQMNFD